MTISITSANIHALIRTLLSIQGTLTAVGVAAYLFLRPRWERRFDELINNKNLDPPEGEEEGFDHQVYRILTHSEQRRLERDVYSTVTRLTIGGWLLFILPFVIALETLLYAIYFSKLPDYFFIIGLSIVFVVKASLIIRPIRYGGVR